MPSRVFSCARARAGTLAALLSLLLVASAPTVHAEVDRNDYRGQYDPDGPRDASDASRGALPALEVELTAGRQATVTG